MRMPSSFQICYVSMVFVQINDYFVVDCLLITNSKYNTFICVRLVLHTVNDTISGIPSWYNNLNNSNHYNFLLFQSAQFI